MYIRNIGASLIFKYEYKTMWLVDISYDGARETIINLADDINTKPKNEMLSNILHIRESLKRAIIIDKIIK